MISHYMRWVRSRERRVPLSRSILGSVPAAVESLSNCEETQRCWVFRQADQSFRDVLESVSCPLLPKNLGGFKRLCVARVSGGSRSSGLELRPLLSWSCC